MSEWQAPPSAQEYPASESDGMKKLIRAVQREAQKRAESTKSLLRSAGITVAETLMTISRGLRIEGDLESTGAAAIGGTLDVTATSTFDGDSTFLGSVVIAGDLAVPNGSISNEALQNPIEEGAIGYSTSGFTVPTTASAVATRTMNIPDGFTKASVMAIISINAWNQSASAGYLLGRATIDDSSGGAVQTGVPAGGYESVTASAIRTLEGLTPGGQITVAATCWATAAFGTSSTNTANIDAIAIFRR